MCLSRRSFLRALPYSLIGGSVLASTISEVQAGWFVNDTISVSIKVQDEAGQPIPFVTVWQFVQMNPAHTRNAGLGLTMEDLWRCTTRYRDTFEFTLRYGEKPVPELRVPAMSNQQGEINNVVDYKAITGESNNYPRPDPLIAGYTFMKRGYFPGKLECVVPDSQGRVDAVVTLKRNAGEALDEQPYLLAYDRIRAELSDTHRNASMTMENHRRLEGVREELTSNAQQAIAMGDKKAAARIYMRMRYLPELTILDGQIAGFKQTNLESARSNQALERAYENDPENLFVQMQTIGTKVGGQVAVKQEERIKYNILQLDELIAKHGNSAWPEMFRWRAGSYAYLGEFAKARTLYLEAAALEPKFTDWQREIEKMKLAMQKKGVAIPANW